MDSGGEAERRAFSLELGTRRELRPAEAAALTPTCQVTSAPPWPGAQSRGRACPAQHKWHQVQQKGRGQILCTAQGRVWTAPWSYRVHPGRLFPVPLLAAPWPDPVEPGLLKCVRALASREADVCWTTRTNLRVPAWKVPEEFICSFSPQPVPGTALTTRDRKENAHTYSHARLRRSKGCW